MSCLLDDGDEVLVPEPYYPNYDTFIRITGASIRPIPTTAEEGYHYADRSRIEPLINEHTRAILITNPGNPTGVVLSEEERRTMVDIAKEHDLFLISDEVYREIVYGGRKVSTMLEYADAAENVVVIDSVSKRFSATGARVGDPEPAAHSGSVQDLPEPVVHCHAGAGRCRRHVYPSDAGVLR